MKNIITKTLLSLSVLFSAVTGFSATKDFVGEFKVLAEDSVALKITIEAGMWDEKDIVAEYTENELYGFVFGQLAGWKPVSHEETFCVTDIGIKKLTVIAEDGSTKDLYSSEQNCDGDDSKTYINYKVFNNLLDSLAIKHVAID